MKSEKNEEEKNNKKKSKINPGKSEINKAKSERLNKIIINRIESKSIKNKIKSDQNK